MSKVNINHSVATVEYCRALHKLTKWDGTIASWYFNNDPAAPEHLRLFLHYTDEMAMKATLGAVDFTSKTPAYDEGYLMRRLKKYNNIKFRIYKFGPFNDRSYMHSAQVHINMDHGRDIIQIDNITPENAACELLINLIFGDIPYAK